MKRLTVQLIIAILLTMSGIVLLFSGFWIDPALEEFTYSRIAVENVLDNTPPAAAKTALDHHQNGKVACRFKKHIGMEACLGK